MKVDVCSTGTFDSADPQWTPAVAIAWDRELNSVWLRVPASCPAFDYVAISHRGAPRPFAEAEDARDRIGTLALVALLEDGESIVDNKIPLTSTRPHQPPAKERLSLSIADYLVTLASVEADDPRLMWVLRACRSRIEEIRAEGLLAWSNRVRLNELLDEDWADLPRSRGVLERLVEVLAERGMVFLFSGLSRDIEAFHRQFERYVVPHPERVGMYVTTFELENWLNVYLHMYSHQQSRGETLWAWEQHLGMNTLLASVAFTALTVATQRQPGPVASGAPPLGNIRTFADWYFADYPQPTEPGNTTRGVAYFFDVLNRYGATDQNSEHITITVPMTSPEMRPVRFLGMEPFLRNHLPGNATLDEMTAVGHLVDGLHGMNAAAQEGEGRDLPHHGRFAILFYVDRARAVIGPHHRLNSVTRHHLLMIPPLTIEEVMAAVELLIRQHPQAERVRESAEAIHSFTCGISWLTKVVLVELEQRLRDLKLTLDGATEQSVAVVKDALQLEKTDELMSEENRAWFHFYSNHVKETLDPVNSIDVELFRSFERGKYADSAHLLRLEAWLASGLAFLDSAGPSVSPLEVCSDYPTLHVGRLSRPLLEVAGATYRRLQSLAA
jgi:hypothetical protein